MENEWNAPCDSLDMEQLNNEAPPQILVPKCGNHNGLPTLHLEYARWSHNSNHIYAKNRLKLVSHPMLNLDHQYKHKGFFYMNINIYFTFVKINIINVHAKFVFEWPTLIGVNILTWAPNTTKHDHFPLWHFFPHSIIFKLHSSHVHGQISMLDWCS